MNREQGRAVVLTAIMVISVFGMGFAFAGGAGAVKRSVFGGWPDPGAKTERLL